jgi:hypothetical protein
MIGLNDNNCWLKNNAHVSCVYLEFCMKYEGVGVPDTISEWTMLCVFAVYALRLHIQYIVYCVQ